MPTHPSQPPPSPDRQHSSATNPETPDLNQSATPQSPLSLAELCDQVRVRLRDCGLSLSWRLTGHDLSIALLNGGSTKTNYVLPMGPRMAQESQDIAVQQHLHSGELDPEAWVVSQKSNPVLFNHVLFGAVRVGTLEPTDIKEFQEVGFIRITPELYIDYLSLLQRSAAVVSQNISRFIIPGTQLIARINSSDGSPYALGATPSRLRVKDRTSSQLVLAAPADFEYSVRMDPREQVVVFGSGYNTLLDTDILRKTPDSPYTIHDNDPFIVAILRHQLNHQGISNVNVDGSELPRVDLGSAPRALVFDLASNLEPLAVRSILRQFAERTTSGRVVFSAQKASDPHGGFTAADMRAQLEAAGYTISHRSELTLRSGWLTNGLDRESLNTMDPHRLANLVWRETQPPSSTRIEIIAAMTS